MSGTPITQDGYEKLSAELERLGAQRASLVDRIGQAVAHGGALTGNGDYPDALHEQERLERRIALLEGRLHGAEVVEPMADGEVDIGERVSVLDLTTGETSDYRIVGFGEADPANGHVSHESPIGAALLGCRVGDVVEVDVPTGIVRLEVVEVDG